MDGIQDFFSSPLGTTLANFFFALLILIVGYIAARFVASLVRRLMSRTNLDDRLASLLKGDGAAPALDIEDIVGKTAFWIIMLFVLVAFFQRLGLVAITTPLNALLQRLTTEFFPRLGGAILLLGLAWVIATALKFLVAKGSELLRIDARLSQHAALEEGEQVTISSSLATAVFWFVFLLFLPSVLERLGISEVARPIQSIFTQAFDYIPNIFAAGLTLLIGWFIARIVRQIVVNLLAALGVDKVGERVGLSGQQTISKLVGTVLYTFILMVALISALDSLSIDAISGPATLMLTTIVNVIPGILGAALVLALSFFIGRLVSNLVAELLEGIGLNNLPEKLGFSWSGSRTLSAYAGYLLLVGIMLFATVSASELLGSAFLTGILTTFIGFLGQLLLAMIIFTIGLYLANLARNVILTAGGRQANFTAGMARVAILVLSGAMALRQLGVADDIVNMAFGIMLGALAVAAALAVGLGSREIAAREVERMLTTFRSSGTEE